MCFGSLLIQFGLLEARNSQLYGCISTLGWGIMQPGGCGMTVAEMSRIDRSIEIKASPERLWRALTSAQELSAWFQVTIEGEIAPGKEVWMTSEHPQHKGQRFRVWFVEMTPPRRFVWQWHPGA